MKRKILFYISHGHGQNGDPGAVSGKFIERDLAIKVAKACNSYLVSKKGRTYKVLYPELRMGKGGLYLSIDNMKTRYYAARYRVVSVDIHFNAGRGDGMEVYCKNTSYSRKLGGLIAKEFKKIGQNYHGDPIKGDNDLMFLKNSGTSVLVECGYVDNITDRKLFDTDAELKKMGEAIAKALINYWGIYK